MYLYAGGCDSNRVAYNQTAADFLKDNYSEYTSVFQQHQWQETPQVISVAEATAMYNKVIQQENASPFIMPAIAAAVIIAVAAVGFAAFRARKSPQGS
jgi:hypothetical protein